MPKFNVLMFREFTSCTNVEVDADSESEAMEKASQLADDGMVDFGEPEQGNDGILDCYRVDSEEPTEEFDDEYTPSSTYGDYSPSNPWDAPGMSIHDFI